MKTVIKVLIVIAVIAALGVVGAKKVKAARAADAAKPVAKIYPIVVPTIRPEVQNVTLTLPYLAEVANDKDVKLSSRISARILSILPSGSHVKKGEVVVSLDTTDIESALQSVRDQLAAATVALKNLEATHKRTLELLKVQGASVEESQKEATMIANTRAQIAGLRQKEIELKNNLSYATITAPVDGVIAKTYAGKGALSAPGKPLSSIRSKNGFYLMVRVPTDLPIRGVVYGGKRYDAVALGSTFHGLAEYKVYPDTSDLTTGDRVEVSVIVFAQKGILLPFDAILDKDGRSYVLEAQGDKAVPVEIHPVQSAEQGVVIGENLEGKTLVVAKPDIMLKLAAGYALKVKE